MNDFSCWTLFRRWVISTTIRIFGKTMIQTNDDVIINWHNTAFFLAWTQKTIEIYIQWSMAKEDTIIYVLSSLKMFEMMTFSSVKKVFMRICLWKDKLGTEKFTSSKWNSPWWTEQQQSSDVLSNSPFFRESIKAAFYSYIVVFVVLQCTTTTWTPEEKEFCDLA